MVFEYSYEKNELLKRTRNISFETVVVLVLENKIIDIIENPNRENQYMYVFRYHNLIHVCPFVVDSDKVFLKAIFPNRKLAKLYEINEEDKNYEDKV